MDSLRDRIGNGLRELRSSEQGIALPVAMLITVIALGFAAVPIVASISSQGGDSHNQAGNEALAAAEAGAELAVLRQGEMRSTEPDDPCGPGGEPDAGWCEGVPGDIGEASFVYQVRPCYAANADSPSCDAVIAAVACTDAEPIQVVSTGAAMVGGREVTKRVQLNACSASLNPEQLLVLEQLEKELKEWEDKREALKTQVLKETEAWVASGGGVKTEKVKKEVPPPNVFAKGQTVGIEWLKMSNNAQVYNGGAGSNGAVTAVGSANVCGTVQYGTTFTPDNSSSKNAPANCAAGRTAVKGTSVYPPVSLPTDIATNNSNWRLVAEDKVPSDVWQRGNIAWNSSKRSLSINYSSLTLGGSAPYYLCQLTLAGGSTLAATSGAKIRIFFDAPENCPTLNGAAQLTIANGTHVSADSGNGPGFYFVGSPTLNKSRVELQGGLTSSQFVIYGPTTTINAANGVNLNGIIVGRSLDLAGGASINKAGAFVAPPLTDFLAPTWEEVVVPLPPDVNVVLVEHEKQLDELTKEVLKRFEEVTKLRTETEGQDQPGSSSVTRDSFVECSAARPASSEAPDSGC